jgi:hypothetical protein
MKTLLFVHIVFLVSCVFDCTSARKRCGILAETCQLLSNGKVFWPLQDVKECPMTPVCHSGYILSKTRIGDLRACCCKLEKIEQCPYCDMSKMRYASFTQFFDDHIDKELLPPDGTCPPRFYKRIFIETGKPDKCCCEPYYSPYLRY